MGLSVALSIYPEAELEAIGQLVRLIGILGVVLMVSAMVTGAAWLVGWSAVLLVVEYGLALINRAASDVRALLVAAGLVLMVESAYASLERRARIPGISRRFVRETLRLLGLGAAAAGAAGVVLALASVPVAYGLLVQVAGVGAAAAVLATLILLVRRRA